MYSRQAVLARAVFDTNPVSDATIRQSWQMRLSRAHPNALVGFAKQAAVAQNIPLVAVLHEELSARNDLPRDIRMEIVGLLNSVKTQSERAADVIYHLTEIAPRRALDAAKRLTPVERIGLGLRLGQLK